MTKEVMKQALKALTNCTDYDNQGNPLEKKDVVNDLAIEALIEALKQSKPLTDEEIRKFQHHVVSGAYQHSFIQGVRYAESAHGIKE